MIERGDGWIRYQFTCEKCQRDDWRWRDPERGGQKPTICRACLKKHRAEHDAQRWKKRVTHGSKQRTV